MSCRNGVSTAKRCQGRPVPVEIPAVRPGTGRLHFFFHSPDSSLPVRDVLDKQRRTFKTEPYIEKGAENYCCNCWQPNIRGFVEGGEQFLFLFTTCRRKDDHKHFGEVYVVGYIKRGRFACNSDGGWSVIGPTRLYAFKDAFPLAKIRDNTAQPRQVRRKLEPKEVSLLLKKLGERRSILGKCRSEVKKLKRQLRNLEPDEWKNQERRAKACRLYS